MMCSLIGESAFEKDSRDTRPLEIVKQPAHQGFSVPLTATPSVDDDVLNDPVWHVGIVRDRDKSDAHESSVVVSALNHALPSHRGRKGLGLVIQASLDFDPQALFEVGRPSRTGQCAISLKLCMRNVFGGHVAAEEM